ncbi:Cyclin-dependent kinase [Bertholletia excelsa]
MGCVSSKQARSPSPAFDSTAVHGETGSGRINSSLLKPSCGFGELGKLKAYPKKENEEGSVGFPLEETKHTRKGRSEKKALFGLRFGKDAELVAAGWPHWLTAVASDAIDGWLPLRADQFEKMDKIGQGTYSSVYRARDVETNKIVALKKIRFDNFQPESVRFMAREILLLRRLDHPNVIKLQGIVTNRLSCNIHLVFEYMEHDLSGLLSSPDIKFTDAQIKCYMQQLLAGLEHCHSRGVMHRDIKTSNILVNNDGVLKIGDFGLANFINPKFQQALTCRVVTLWYRPPELLLGSTTYGASVDIWSVGCVFAELFFRKPLLKGRTEVEQLHKILKLCGSPPDDYWKKYKLPLASMFKPQHPYVSSLQERCKELPKSAVSLLENFLSIEPHQRGTALSALNSEYFAEKPFACDPSSLPRYPPRKEIDVKLREEAQRRKAGFRSRASGISRNPKRSHNAPEEPSAILRMKMEAAAQFAHRDNGAGTHFHKATVSEASQATERSQADSKPSIPLPSASSGFAWAKRQKEDVVPMRFRGLPSSKSQNLISLDPSSVLHGGDTWYSEEQESEEPAKILSGPLFSQPQRVDEGQGGHFAEPATKSRFSRGF